MTNEQLTQNVVDLMTYKAKAEEEHDMFKSMLQNMRDDIKETKKLAEDVHIMAINMKNMQEAQEKMSKKVDALTSEEFMEYKENKKLIKQNIISKVTGGVIGFILAIIIFVIGLYMKGSDVNENIKGNNSENYIASDSNYKYST